MSDAPQISLGAPGAEAVFSLTVKRRSGARNLVLRLLSESAISVSAPARAPMGDIEEFVRRNEGWIFEERRRFAECKSLKRHFESSPFIWSGGVRLRVTLLETRAKPYWLEDAARGEIAFAFGDDADLKALFLKYARESLGRTLGIVASSRGLAAGKFSVRDQRSRWASRSSTGMLSFNWRIALLEHRFQEYIILHELAHEKFMDHSVSFWIYLSRLCGNARALDREISGLASEIFMLER